MRVFNAPKPTRGSPVAGTPDQFPLAVHASGRYLVDAQGTPFLIHGDTPWSIAAQLTDAECDQYIDDRAAKGFTAIMFNAIEHKFTSQSPEYRNVDGVDPLTSMTDFGSALVSAYWTRVDRIVNRCKAAGMVCIIHPAYLGWNGGLEGWATEVSVESDADLQTYGATLATRYTQGNVIWCMGGDYSPGSTLVDKQWQIITGIRTVRTNDIVTAHGGGANAYPTWSGKTGFNLNNVYTSSSIYSECATEYARSGPIPFFLIEARYEQEGGPPISAAGLRRQSYQALLSGACGQFFGNNPIWHFESPNTLFSYSGTWESNLDSAGSTQQQYVKALFAAFEWWKLVPKTDTSLVSSSLSSGDSRLCPALASDGSFALIWVPTSQSVTVVMTNFTPSSVRVRLYDPTAGTYSTVGTYANIGTQSIATGGERVIVLDAG